MSDQFLRTSTTAKQSKSLVELSNVKQKSTQTHNKQRRGSIKYRWKSVCQKVVRTKSNLIDGQRKHLSFRKKTSEQDLKLGKTGQPEKLHYVDLMKASSIESPPTLSSTVENPYSLGLEAVSSSVSSTCLKTSFQSLRKKSFNVVVDSLTPSSLDPLLAMSDSVSSTCLKTPFQSLRKKTVNRLVPIDSLTTCKRSKSVNLIERRKEYTRRMSIKLANSYNKIDRIEIPHKPRFQKFQKQTKNDINTSKMTISTEIHEPILSMIDMTCGRKERFILGELFMYFYFFV